jgi:urea transport system ATP-binding protein
LVQDPRLLILDEPVAGMTREERTQTGRVLQQIARNHTVIVVEHDMDFLRKFATRVTVMHEGKVLTEGPVASVTNDPRVQEVYLGKREEAALDEATG